MILKEKHNKFIIPYLDDIIIFSNNEEDHLKHIERILSKLKTTEISLNDKKCKFGLKEIKILGNIVSEGKIKPDPEKQKAIRNFTKPMTLNELRSFLGLTNYCRCFIPKYAAIVKPLSDLLKGQTKKSKKAIVWSERSIQAFNTIKMNITEVTERAQPDLNKPMILITDASDQAIGAILAQKDELGREKMIAAFSKTLVIPRENTVRSKIGFFLKKFI